MAIISFTAILFISATTLAVVTGQDTGNCVSLGNSQTCSAFSQFYIGLPDLSAQFPFLINVTTIEQFDQRLLAYVNSTSNYLFPLGCLSSNYNPTIPYARYSLTRLCAAMIQNPTYSLPCNFNNELTPPPLCQTTCNQWVDSVTHITDNPRVCSDSTQRSSTLAYYNEQCTTWEGFNGTISDNCISGIANEPYTCGFGPGNYRMACRYCAKFSDDRCCQNVDGCSRSLSAGAIVGIVIGCIVAVALAIFATLFFCCRGNRKNRKNKPFSNNPFHFMSASAASSATTHNKEYKNQSKDIINESTLPIPPLEAHPTNNSNKLQVASDFSATIIPSTAAQTPSNEEFYVAIHPYPPQMPDELELNSGDIVCLALHFDDGWALGFNVTNGLKGVFPLVCVSPASEESLDQLLNNTNEEVDNNRNVLSPSPRISVISSTPSTQQQLHLTMEKIRENVSRSLSLNSYNNNNNIHHPYTNTTTTNTTNPPTNINTTQLGHYNTIPKRSVSYKSSSYDYIEADSPSSPTLHTPFFDYNHPPVQKAQPSLQQDDIYEMKPSPSLS